MLRTLRGQRKIAGLAADELGRQSRSELRPRMAVPLPVLGATESGSVSRRRPASSLSTRFRKATP
jgi:hypothetical protein